MSLPPSERLLERIRAEYLEMPGLCLTSEQVQRLCGVERTICQLVLDSSLMRIIVEPSGGIGVPRKEWRRIHHG